MASIVTHCEIKTKFSLISVDLEIYQWRQMKKKNQKNKHSQEDREEKELWKGGEYGTDATEMSISKWEGLHKGKRKLGNV